jgi:hypothetical protein
MEASQLLETALKEHPDMLRKLTTFIEDYRLSDKPALIWQCRPKDTPDIDVSGQAILDALRAGSESQRDNWQWSDFKSGSRSVAVFDGIASHAHIIAGIWGFPESEGVKFATDTYIDAFLDFGSLASNLLNASAITGECLITCTLLNAAELTFSLNGRPNSVNRVRRQHLQWRVRKCEGTRKIAEPLRLMATEYMRAYGYFRQISAEAVGSIS